MKYKEVDVDIRDVQKVQVEILLEFDRICKENNINYQLFAGTLLGCIRHKGFIPWDDDIDVCLLRSDYERFIDCCKSNLNENYFLQTYESDKNSYLQFAKLRKNHTVFTNFSDIDTNMHNGIYIDIFPLDNVSQDSILGKLHPRIFNFLYLYSSSSVKNRALNTKSKLNRRIRMMMYYSFKVIPKGIVDKLATRIARVYEKKDTNYVSHLTNGVSKDRIRKFLGAKDEFYEIIYKEFEGHLFPVPKNYHDVLTKNFGDYMKLPPEDKRYPHHGIIEINFNTREK